MELVNEALVKFSLKYLKTLKYISFRGELKADMKALLMRFGFKPEKNLEFPLILRGSGKMIDHPFKNNFK